MKRQSKHHNQIQMSGMLELSDQKFKITMINFLRALMDKVDGAQEQMDNNREMEILRNYQKEMLEILKR